MGQLKLLVRFFEKTIRDHRAQCGGALQLGGPPYNNAEERYSVLLARYLWSIPDILVRGRRRACEEKVERRDTEATRSANPRYG